MTYCMNLPSPSGFGTLAGSVFSSFTADVDMMPLYLAALGGACALCAVPAGRMMGNRSRVARCICRRWHTADTSKPETRRSRRDGTRS